MRRFTYLYTLLLALSTTIKCGATAIGFAYWDVDALHDTSPSLFYDDSHYTPDGQLNWSEHRYRDKIQGVASILDSLQMPIIAIAGVENEEVVRDIVSTTSLGYNYIHRTLPSVHGLDIALLYFGDILQPHTVRTIEGKLHITCEIMGKEWDLWLIQNGTPNQGVNLNHQDNRRVVIAGNISHFEGRKFRLHDPLHQSEKRGYGSTYSYMGWYLRDRILISPDITALSFGIYINRQLLDESHRPQPTYDNKNYRGGISRHLPIFVYLKIPE